MELRNVALFIPSDRFLRELDIQLQRVIRVYCTMSPIAYELE
jgi:hypothetical protein